jgi:hypothetical protein
MPLSKNMTMPLLAILLVLALGQGAGPAQNLALGASGSGIVLLATVILLHAQQGLPPGLALKLDVAQDMAPAVPARTVLLTLKLDVALDMALDMAPTLPTRTRCIAPVQTGKLAQANTTKCLPASGSISTGTRTQSVWWKPQQLRTT